jgi:hypothetical protein
MQTDAVKVKTVWRVERWDSDQTEWTQTRTGLATPSAANFRALNVLPYDVSRVEGNLLTTAGLTRITALLTAAGGQGVVATSTRLGTGNGAASAVVGDTDLGAAAGSTNRWYQIMDSTYPQTAAGVLTVKSTFASADGNYAWNEFGIDVAAPTVASSAVVGALLLNHKTSIAQGTKASGQTWAATATLTLS